MREEDNCMWQAVMASEILQSLWGSERSIFSLEGWIYGDEETFQAMCL